MDYIPIIDMAKIDEITNEVTNNQHWISTAQKIREGLGGIGFMYLKNHHIDTSLVRLWCFILDVKMASKHTFLD